MPTSETGGSTVINVGYNPDRPGETVVWDYYSVTGSPSSFGKGSHLCSFSVTYAATAVERNFGHSDKTETPKERNRKSFSDNPSGPKEKKNTR